MKLTSTKKQKSKTKGSFDTFATYVHSHRICHLEDFTVSKLLNKKKTTSKCKSYAPMLKKISP